MAKPTNQVSSLLAAIQRKGPATEAPASAAVSAVEIAPPVKATSVKAARARVGKPVQFWLHEEDRRIVRELSAWLAGQGVRPTDSMVVRAALRMARTGSGLLDAYRDAAQLDGRLKSRKAG